MNIYEYLDETGISRRETAEFEYEEYAEEELEDYAEDDTHSNHDSDSDEDNASNAPVLPDPMKITEREREWAQAIKDAVEQAGATNRTNGRPRLRPVSDTEYAQHALVSMGDAATALQRIENLHWFRDEYGIDDTPEQGVQCLHQWMNLQPGFLLRIDVCPDTGEGILVADHGAFYPSRALVCSSTDHTAEQNWKIHARGHYYLLRTLNPSLRSIREGVFALMEASTMSWGNYSSTYMHRMQQELRAHYPMKFKKCMVYNTSGVANLVYALAKRFMPRDFIKVVEVGCQIHQTDSICLKPPMTLPDLYLEPTSQAAQGYLLKRVGEILAMRAENEKNFRLVSGDRFATGNGVS